MTGKDLAKVCHAVVLVADRGDRGIDVEIASVFAHSLVIDAGEFDEEIPERLVSLLTNRDAHGILHGQRFGFLLPALVQEIAQLGEGLVGPGVLILVRLAGPDRVLVELNPLAAHPAEDHGAESPVAHGKGFHPLRGGLAIPERKLLVRRPGCAASGRESGQANQSHA